MELRGVRFRNVINASGARGFFGEGYAFHKFFRPFGLDYNGSTFVGKTTTLPATKGNMPLKDDFTPKEFKPKCIVVKLGHGSTLNAVGLSGPGSAALINCGYWQQFKESFFISWMSTDHDRQGRIDEFRAVLRQLIHYHSQFKAKFGLKINVSCPNVGLNTAILSNDVGAYLEAPELADLDWMPIVFKFNLFAPVTVVAECAEHPRFSGACWANTTPWKDLPDDIKLKVFGSVTSPLSHLGGGGFSGPQMRPKLLEVAKEAKEIKFPKPIYFGTGIYSVDDAREVLAAGPQQSGISLGTISIHRPLSVQKIIRFVNDHTS